MPDPGTQPGLPEPEVPPILPETDPGPIVPGTQPDLPPLVPEPAEPAPVVPRPGARPPVVPEPGSRPIVRWTGPEVPPPSPTAASPTCPPRPPMTRVAPPRPAPAPRRPAWPPDDLPPRHLPPAGAPRPGWSCWRWPPWPSCCWWWGVRPHRRRRRVGLRGGEPADHHHGRRRRSGGQRPPPTAPATPTPTARADHDCAAAGPSGPSSRPAGPPTRTPAGATASPTRRVDGGARERQHHRHPRSGHRLVPADRLDRHPRCGPRPGLARPGRELRPQPTTTRSWASPPPPTATTTPPCGSSVRVRYHRARHQPRVRDRRAGLRPADPPPRTSGRRARASTSSSGRPSNPCALTTSCAAGVTGRHDPGMLGLQVIGAGFGRTGTLSLRRALDDLGFGPTYHGEDLLHHWSHVHKWHRSPPPAPPTGTTCSPATAPGSTSRWPAPGASWPPTTPRPRSCSACGTRAGGGTAWTTRSTRPAPCCRPGSRGCSGPREYLEMTDILIWDGIFADRFQDRDHAIEVFERHVEEVTASLPPERLLVFDVAEGWGRCAPSSTCRCRPTPSPASTTRPRCAAGSARPGC